MDPLRAAPGADDRARRPGGRAGRLGGRRRGARRAARPRAARARPGGRGRRAGRRAARGRARRRHADRPRALRDRDDQHRRLRVRPRRRAHARRYERPGCAAGRWSSARRSSEDLARRDFTVNAIAVQPRRRRAHASGRARARTSTTACCASCTSARSSTTRRGCCGSSATPRGWASHPIRPRDADRPGAARDRDAATALGNELRLLLDEPRRGAAAARAPGASARALLGRRVPRRSWLRRARPDAACSRSPRAARRSLARRSPPASTSSGSAAASATSSWPRRDGFERLHGTWTAATPTLWRLLRRERAETVSCSPRAGDRGRAALARRRPPPPARDLRRRPDRRRASTGAAVGAALDAAMARCSTAARRTARRSWRAALAPRELVNLPAPFRWENDQIVADLPHARARVLDRRGGVSERAVRLAEPRPADRRRAARTSTRTARRLAATVGHPWERFCYGRQVHGDDGPARHRAAVGRSGPYTRGGRPGDRARATPPAIVFTADCLPVLLAADGARGRAALRLAPAGRRDRRRGRRGAARGRRRAARSPPRSAPAPRLLLRGRRGGPRAVRRLRRAPRRAQPRPRGGGARAAARRRRRQVHDTGLCTMCDAACFFSHRRDQRRHRPPGGGHMPRLITGLDAATIRANLERVRERDRRRRARPGRGRDPRRGQVRPAGGDRRARARPGSRCWARTAPRSSRPRRPRTPSFRWHFIGQLQSRKVKQILPYVELIHSVASRVRAATSSSTHGTPETEILLEVNVAGEEGKAGHRARTSSPRYLERAPVQGRGPDDDAAVRRGSRGQPAALRAPARARRRARPARSSRWARRRTSRSLQRKVQRLCGSARRSIRRSDAGKPAPAANRPTRHGLERLLPQSRSSTSASPRTATTTTTTSPSRRPRARARAREPLPGAPERPPPVLAPPPRRDRRHLRRRLAVRAPHHAAAHRRGHRRTAANGRGEVRVHLVVPKSFNDAQDVADKFKDSIPVIVNLQGSDADLSKRLIDFASGLTYALDGGMQRIADKVFLLTPRNVEVSAEERAALIEKGFFNQSLRLSPAAHAGRLHRIREHGGRARPRLGRARARHRQRLRPRGGAGGTSSAARRVVQPELRRARRPRDPRPQARTSSRRSPSEIGDARAGSSSRSSAARPSAELRGRLPGRAPSSASSPNTPVAVRRGVTRVRRARRRREADARRGAVRARRRRSSSVPERLIDVAGAVLRRRPRVLGADRRGVGRRGDPSRHPGGPSRHTGDVRPWPEPPRCSPAAPTRSPLRRAVTSPGGSTARGLAALERGGVRAALADAMDAWWGPDGGAPADRRLPRRADPRLHADHLRLDHRVLVFSFGVRVPYSRPLNAVLDFLRDVTNPYLRIFRRLGLQFGPIDFSPIVAILVLQIGGRLIVGLIAAVSAGRHGAARRAGRGGGRRRRPGHQGARARADRRASSSVELVPRRQARPHPQHRRRVQHVLGRRAAAS